MRALYARFAPPGQCVCVLAAPSLPHLPTTSMPDPRHCRTVDGHIQITPDTTFPIWQVPVAGHHPPRLVARPAQPLPARHAARCPQPAPHGSPRGSHRLFSCAQFFSRRPRPGLLAGALGRAHPAPGCLPAVCLGAGPLGGSRHLAGRPVGSRIFNSGWMTPCAAGCRENSTEHILPVPPHVGLHASSHICTLHQHSHVAAP